MSRYFSGYDRFGINLFTDSGDVGAELERLLYTYARNLLGRHRPSIEFLYFLFDLVPEAMRKRIADLLSELSVSDIQRDSFRDASSLAQLVTTVAAENPKTDHRVTQVLQEYFRECHQSSNPNVHNDEPLTEAARAMQQLFGLTDAEREVLLFLYALSQFEGLETVWTSHPPHGRPKLISVATGIDKAAVANALSNGSRMMLTGLLQITTGQNNYLVSLTSDVIAAISHQTPGSMKDSYLIEMKPSSVDIDSFTVPETARNIIRSLIESHERHHILLVGPPGAGKTEFIRSITRSAGKTPLLYRLQSDSTAAIEFRRITASSYLMDSDREILILDECDHILNSRAVFAGNADTVTKGKINTLLDSSECGTIWIVNDADYLDVSVRRRFSYILDYPRPTLRQRTRLWSTIVAGRTDISIPRDTIETLAHRYPVSTGEFTSALAVVNSLSIGTDGSPPVQSILEELLRSRSPGSGMYGNGKAEELITDAYDPTVLRTEPDLHHLTGALTVRHERDGGRGIQARLLFHGPPGTGKTRFARHLADRLDMDLITVTAAELLSEFVGRTEKSIAAAFRQAQAQDAVLLLDEVDSILSDRTKAIRSWERTQVNQLLTELDSYQGVVIARSNLTSVLDRAVLRRFDAKVELKSLDSSGANGVSVSGSSPTSSPALSIGADRVHTTVHRSLLIKHQFRLEEAMSTNTEVQTRPNAEETAIQDVTRELLVKYLDTFGLAAELTEEEKEQFIQVAIAYQLDPFRREIHVVPYGQGEFRKLSLIVGYEVYLKWAENTGRPNGWAVWTEGTGDEMKAVVEIHRKDWATPFRHEVPWLEAAQYNREGKLTAFWRRMPKFQLKKVAISQGFRLAFPDDLGGLPYDASELPPEMSIERDVTPNKSEPDPESPQPQPTKPAQPVVIGVPPSNPNNGRPDRRLDALQTRLSDHKQCFSDNHLHGSASNWKTTPLTRISHVWRGT